MSSNKLFSAYRLGAIDLKNRIVMAPMTRSRAIGNIPNDLMATYYAQRAAAGLIITEGVSPSPNGLGYARIPGIFSKEQIEGWKKVTRAVHEAGGRIFMQMMHTGRISHPLNLPAGGRVLAPSEIGFTGQLWTDSAGMQAVPVPQAMSTEDLEQVKNEFVQGAKNAIAAGFDGVELHGANGYLLEQFLSPFGNQRTDAYGGSVQNRARFVLELVEAVAKAIGTDKTGIRLSPYGAANDMKAYPEIDETYRYLATELGRLGILYIHLVDHSSMGAPVVPASIKRTIAEAFGRTIILAGGYTKKTAEADLQHNAADLIGFGKPFINNPDLVYRLQHNKPLSHYLDKTSFYSPGEKGFTDYPVYEHEEAVI
ncbi:MAG TPA: alkene reductase [Puia sp.]|nr:alkene reductase [Puia sp.]